MFAILGNTKLQLVSSINDLNETNSYNYVQHERIENVPILQFLGRNLKEMNIRINLHSSFCIPEQELKNLTEIAEKATPVNFTKGNGEYLGYFLIQEIGQTIEQTTINGDLIAVQTQIKLLEYPGKIDDETKNIKGLKQK